MKQRLIKNSASLPRGHKRPLSRALSRRPRSNNQGQRPHIPADRGSKTPSNIRDAAYEKHQSKHHARGLYTSRALLALASSWCEGGTIKRLTEISFKDKLWKTMGWRITFEAGPDVEIFPNGGPIGETLLIVPIVPGVDSATI